MDYGDILFDAAHAHPESVAMWYLDEVWSYSRLASAADHLGAQLYRCGVRPGTRVALCVGNEPAWVISFFALARLRVSVVMVSTAWRGHELRHCLETTRPSAVIATADSLARLDESRWPDLCVVVGDSTANGRWTTFDSLLAAAPAPEVPWSRSARADDELALPFSSGTTGLPKAVLHTHGSLTVATRQWRSALDVGPADRLQAVTPLSHILGIVNVGATFLGGAAIRLFPRFGVAEMVDGIERDRTTIGITVAPIASALTAMPALESRDLSSLRYLNWSATPINADIAREFTHRTGVAWQPAYGSTEVPILAVSPVDRLDQSRLYSVGRAADAVEVEAMDPDSTTVLPRGSTGELVARSPARMAGYLPESTPSPFTADGWYRTGDLGSVDADGWIVISGRLKELIKVSGYQVSPVEIETVLSRSPDVADCAVVGIPDERRGEIPCAVVVRAAGSSADERSLIEWLAPELARYKRLGHVVFVDEIPRSASGKILRRRLTETVSGRSS
ncbi:acyl--CoA ligase [Nocardia sp. NBC_01377]|uniref:class I adenylate-forming enzyme family protein n=1 Tax=Nocardia sp. NBC_01377 TaxID=2903595 RepID=UPI0032460B0C